MQTDFAGNRYRESTLQRIQNEQKVWADYNFGPDGHGPEKALLGLVEEVGELAHAHLKHAQARIRGFDEEAFKRAARDAAGDIQVYLLDYVSGQGWSMEEILEEVWGHVSVRDWKKFPNDGRTH
jgi:NTP pyrophosphatase (non-canonical NTP hydrolase)